jgi:peptidoglycan/LPS O-acetylase OafA/YrhL
MDNSSLTPSSLVDEVPLRDSPVSEPRPYDRRFVAVVTVLLVVTLVTVVIGIFILFPETWKAFQEWLSSFSSGEGGGTRK